MGRKAVNKIPAFVDAVVETGARQLTKQLACDDERARAVMRDIARDICFQYSRSIIYVPCDVLQRLNERDDAFCAEYGQDGPTGLVKYTAPRLEEVAQKFGVTIAHAYAIVKARRTAAVPAPSAPVGGTQAPAPSGNWWELPQAQASASAEVS